MMFFTARNKSKRLVLLPLCAWVQSHVNHIWLFATMWTAVCQAPLPMEFPRQAYWSSLPCPSPGDLPDPGFKPTWAGGFFTTSATWEDWVTLTPLLSSLFFFYFSYSLIWEFMIHHQFSCYGYLCTSSEFTIGITRGSVTLLPELVLCTWEQELEKN